MKQTFDPLLMLVLVVTILLVTVLPVYVHFNDVINFGIFLLFYAAASLILIGIYLLRHIKNKATKK